MKKLCEILDITMGTIILIATIIAVLLVFGLMLQALAPIITILVVFFFTLHALKKWSNAFLAFSGIIIYAISWCAVHFLGDLSAQLLCSAGVFLWLAAVSRSFEMYYATELQSEG